MQLWQVGEVCSYMWLEWATGTACTDAILKICSPFGICMEGQCLRRFPGPQVYFQGVAGHLRDRAAEAATVLHSYGSLLA